MASEKLGDEPTILYHMALALADLKRDTEAVSIPGRNPPAGTNATVPGKTTGCRHSSHVSNQRNPSNRIAIREGIIRNLGRMMLPRIYCIYKPRIL
ncbi:MAG: hypothetical protein MZU95_11580 [Desulfomicrobium escambiense]|nr:hypothetical protein [Desulfomicrobium escambiense]